MSDLFGHVETLEPFKDIRNQRDKVAEEKAVLTLQLKELVMKCPPSIATGSVQLTHRWLESQKSARKVLNNQRSSVNELQASVNSMRQFLE